MALENHAPVKIHPITATTSLTLISGTDETSTGLELRANTSQYGTEIVFWKHPTSTTVTDRIGEITAHGTAIGSLVDEMAFYTTDTLGAFQNRFKLRANVTNTPIILTGGTGLARTSGNTIDMGESVDGGGVSAFTFENNVRVATYLRIGSTSAATNTGTGDLTALRLNLGNSAFGANGRIIRDASSVLTDTAAGAAYYAFFQPSFTPASNSSSDARLLGFDGIVNPATTITLNIVRAGYFQMRYRGDGAIAQVQGINSTAAVLDSSSAATVGTITLAQGVAGNVYSRASGTSAVSITTGVAFDVPALSTAGATITDLVGLRIADATSSTITNQIGIDIAALTRGGTSDIGIRIAKADTYTLQLSDTGGTAAGGITFGTDATFYRSAADTLKTDDKLIIALETNMVGDLNHDGTNIGFFGVTPTTRQTEMTDELTTITFSAPGTPDYAIQNLVAAVGYGFVTADEGQTVLSVIANLQTRVNELETKLTAYGLLQDAD